jgi:hypothetical protein
VKTCENSACEPMRCPQRASVWTLAHNGTSFNARRASLGPSSQDRNKKNHNEKRVVGGRSPSDRAQRARGRSLPCVGGGAHAGQVRGGAVANEERELSKRRTLKAAAHLICSGRWDVTQSTNVFPGSKKSRVTQGSVPATNKQHQHFW